MTARITAQELAGRRAIVTGSARNIGREIAMELARGGAAVLINARTSQAEAEAVAQEIRAGGGVSAVSLADVSTPSGAAAVIGAATDAFGGVDILVNNAAIRREVDFADLGYAEWREVLATTLDGAYLCCHAAMPHMVSGGGGGAIVNIGGLSAHLGA